MIVETVTFAAAGAVGNQLAECKPGAPVLRARTVSFLLPRDCRIQLQEVFSLSVSYVTLSCILSRSRLYTVVLSTRVTRL